MRPCPVSMAGSPRAQAPSARSPNPWCELALRSLLALYFSVAARACPGSDPVPGDQLRPPSLAFPELALNLLAPHRHGRPSGFPAPARHNLLCWPSLRALLQAPSPSAPLVPLLGAPSPWLAWTLLASSWPVSSSSLSSVRASPQEIEYVLFFLFPRHGFTAAWSLASSRPAAAVAHRYCACHRYVN